MNEHARTKKELAAFLRGELEEARRRAMAEHIDKCGECRAETEALERLLKETEAVRSEIREAAASIEWEALPAAIADRAMAAAAKPGRAPSAARPWPGLFELRMKPVLAGLAAGLAVGAVAMYLALRPPVPRPDRDAGYHASGEFLDRAELEMARRNTLDYLERSQYVLLDVFESGVTGAAAPAAVRAERARDIVQRKKYLNAQLERYQMAKAKAICDQIEALFRELAEIGEDLPAAEMGRLRDLVEARQLLLKINLVKRELQSGV